MNQRPESETETNAATPEVRKRVEKFARRGFLQRILDRFYGYDFFISYTWSDGRTYAVKLAEQLKARGFDCFLDSEDYLKGQNWKSFGERALKKTTSLVLVGSPNVHQSEPVRRELEIFTKANDDEKIITINFGTETEDKEGSLFGRVSEGSPLKKYLDKDKIFFAETMEQLSKGPSPDTVGDLQRDFKKQRQSQKRARALRIAGGVFVMLIALASWAVWRWDEGTTNKMVVELTSSLAAEKDIDKLSRRFSALRNEEMGGDYRKSRIISALESRRDDFPATSTDKGDLFAKARAHAAIVLIDFDKPDLAKEFLYLKDRPEPLAQFADRCKTPGGLSREQVIKFSQHVIEKSFGDPTYALVGYSALLGIGEYRDQGDLSPEFLSQLQKWYREHPNAAIHSACAWLLGPDVVARLNEDLVGPISLDPSTKDWFVVKLETRTNDSEVDVDYITFIVFKDEQSVFAVADRETTIGVCNQLGGSSLYDYGYFDVTERDDDPANLVGSYEEAEMICAEFSKRFKTLSAHLPSQAEWASAWGTRIENEHRPFQFGSDASLLPRYATVGDSSTGTGRPTRVATQRPSTTGMFDMHGNVAEWTIESTDSGPVGRMRGGAVEQDIELVEWDYKIPHSQHTGFRFCVSPAAGDQSAQAPGE